MTESQPHPEEEPLSLEPESQSNTNKIYVPPKRKLGEDSDEAPIKLVEDGEGTVAGEIRGFGSASKGSRHKDSFKRPMNLTGKGATRCRIFHCKIADGALEYMENQINDWIDDSEIDVKEVGHMVGTMEGKRAEPNVIVIVWY